MIDLLERTADESKSASVLTTIELRSAIRHRQYSGDTTEADSESAARLAREEGRRMILHPVSDWILEEALRLTDVQKLRALDAVQLATALSAHTLGAQTQRFLFVASDKRLLAAARAEGLETWNPMEGPLRSNP